jgi:hypothetical protein
MGTVVSTTVLSANKHEYIKSSLLLKTILYYYLDNEFSKSILTDAVTSVNTEYKLMTSEQVAQYQNVILFTKESDAKLSVDPKRTTVVPSDGKILFMPICFNGNNEIVNQLYSGSAKEVKSLGCFPYNAIAKTSLGYKMCCDLVIGDKVLSGYVNGKPFFEPILFFGHKEDILCLFIELTIENKKKISATDSHYIYRYNNHNKELVRFKDIKPGDYIKYKNKRIKVSSSNTNIERGIVSPFTQSCKIVINDIQASCITDDITKSTVHPIIKILNTTGFKPSEFMIEQLRNSVNKIVTIVTPYQKEK